MSIKVAVRVRPFNQREKERESNCIIEMNGNVTTIKDEMGQEKTFAFDYSFWSHDGFIANDSGYSEPIDERYADQRVVFECVGKEILNNAWEGYHCCLFAYGQTGSGKSYSMVGYGANKGIVPISCDEIFRRIQENTDSEKAYEVQVSMLEIYNEKVQDLLAPANKRPPNGLKIRESKTIGVFVEGLTKHPVTSYEEISKKMDEGYENRTIGSTLMNATSSRAHTIVTVEFKQITFVNGKRSEKLSMINLVDLAGSERSSSTGATGDRLKEGCNINKSLLVLGNVINTLADKAMGKNKNALPPYRDSALTRILQNALGGNSKTVMICALSPASINYEETLSTLRYADRAKKIQNKAVINESEQDKMVRLLKEENLELKKMIEDLNKKITGGGGAIGEEDKRAFLDLKEQYEANSKVMEDMQKSFSERIEEAKIREKETLGEKVDINFPHLVVLNEDPQLSHKLKYSLKALPIYVGRKHGNPTPQITLSGIGIKVNHAIFLTNEKGEIILIQNESEAKEYIFINGRKITGNDGQVLKSKDRITFGTNTILLFLKKSTGQDILDIDWESAQMELQKVIEQENKKQEEENEKKKQEELDNIKKDLEEKYSKEKQEIEEKLKKQLIDYEAKFTAINQNVEKSKLEAERSNIENLVKQRIDLLEAEKARKTREVELKEKNDLIRKENQQKEREFVHRSENLEMNLQNIVKKINKMKILMAELKRDINLEVCLNKNLKEHYDNAKNTPISIFIKVENYEEGTVYYWNTETFQNRYDMMKELFDKYNDEDYDIFNLKNEEDPIWDEAKPTLVGYSFYKLEPLAYLMSNPITTSIISVTGVCMGKITLDIIPHDDNIEFDEIPDDPFELIGQPLNFRVMIKECYDLPDNFCRGAHVEYTSFHDNMVYKTKEVEVKTKNPLFKECFEHHIEYLTKEDIEFLIKELLCFKVFAFEEVEKKGKISRENSGIDIDNSANPFEKDSRFGSSSKNSNTLLQTKMSNNLIKSKNSNNLLQSKNSKDQIKPDPSKTSSNIIGEDSSKKKDCIIY